MKINLEYFGFLKDEITSSSTDIQERFYDIIHSIVFSMYIENVNKIDFEFNNLLDLLDEIDSENKSKAFAAWKQVIDDLKIIYEN